VFVIPEQVHAKPEQRSLDIVHYSPIRPQQKGCNGEERLSQIAQRIDFLGTDVFSSIEKDLCSNTHEVVNLIYFLKNLISPDY